MIEFFELLNNCSPLRATVYLLFTLALVNIIFNGLNSILYNIFYLFRKRNKINKD